MDKQPYTWPRDLAVLQAIAPEVDELGSLDAAELPPQLEMDDQQVRSALRALAEGDYIRWEPNPYSIGRVFAITEKARREIGMWPSAENVTDEIEAVLDKRIAETSDPEKRSRWKQVRDTFGGATRDLVVDVMGAVITKGLTG